MNDSVCVVLMYILWRTEECMGMSLAQCMHICNVMRMCVHGGGAGCVSFRVCMREDIVGGVHRCGYEYVLWVAACGCERGLWRVEDGLWVVGYGSVCCGCGIWVCVMWVVVHGCGCELWIVYEGLWDMDIGVDVGMGCVCVVSVYAHICMYIHAMCVSGCIII